MTRSIVTNIQHVLKNLQKISILQSYRKLLKLLCPMSRVFSCYASRHIAPRTLSDTETLVCLGFLQNKYLHSCPYSVCFQYPEVQPWQPRNKTGYTEGVQVFAKQPLTVTDLWTLFGNEKEFQVSINSAWEVNITDHSRATSLCPWEPYVYGEIWNKAVRSAQI